MNYEVANDIDIQSYQAGIAYEPAADAQTVEPDSPDAGGASQIDLGLHREFHEEIKSSANIRAALKHMRAGAVDAEQYRFPATVAFDHRSLFAPERSRSEPLNPESTSSEVALHGVVPRTSSGKDKATEVSIDKFSEAARAAENALAAWQLRLGELGGPQREAVPATTEIGQLDSSVASSSSQPDLNKSASFFDAAEQKPYPILQNEIDSQLLPGTQRAARLRKIESSSLIRIRDSTNVNPMPPANSAVAMQSQPREKLDWLTVISDYTLAASLAVFRPGNLGAFDMQTVFASVLAAQRSELRRSWLSGFVDYSERWIYAWAESYKRRYDLGD